MHKPVDLASIRRALAGKRFIGFQPAGIGDESVTELRSANRSAASLSLDRVGMTKSGQVKAGQVKIGQVKMGLIKREA
jgi:hypothetical protein